ncbi:hypothetical protein MTO96_028375 [Rhipicephalus appendiculatus]
MADEPVVAEETGPTDLDDSSNCELFTSESPQDDNTLMSDTVVTSFNYCTKPVQVCGAWKAFSKFITRGCKWSPDGSCLLTNSDDCCLRIFNLPAALCQQRIDWNEMEEMVPQLVALQAQVQETLSTSGMHTQASCGALTGHTITWMSLWQRTV